MANVKDDDVETLDFADEGEEIDSDERYEIADMIADCFGRSVIDADLDLAARIIARVRGEDQHDQHWSGEPNGNWPSVR